MPEPDSSDRGIYDFNHSPEVKQLLFNVFELIGNLPSVKRTELWFVNTFPPTHDSGDRVRPNLPQIWRVKDNSKDPIELNRLSRVEVPINYKKSVCGMAVAYLSADNRDPNVQNYIRDMLQLAISGLEVSLSLAVKSAQAEPQNAEIVADVITPSQSTLSLGKQEEMMQALNSEFSRAMRHSLDLALMMIEVDTFLIRDLITSITANASLPPTTLGGNFSRFNFPSKAYEANPSEEIMKYVAYLTTKYLRISDAAYLFDNTHVGVILPHSDEIQAYRAADKLLKMIDSNSYFGSLGLVSTQWSHVGISCFPYLSNNVEMLIKHSQQALARAKRGGSTTKPYSATTGLEINYNSPKYIPSHIYIWKATKMLSMHDINEISDRQAVRAVMRGFKFVELSHYIDQLADPKRRSKFKPIFDLIPYDIARQHQAIAINHKKQTGSEALTVVMADPGNTVAVSNIVQITGANVITEVARADQIQQIFDIMRV
jgi:GGDEF domain-containing protein